jgi:hypothetical protein
MAGGADSERRKKNFFLYGGKGTSGEKGVLFLGEALLFQQLGGVPQKNVHGAVSWLFGISVTCTMKRHRYF